MQMYERTTGLVKTFVDRLGTCYFDWLRTDIQDPGSNLRVHFDHLEVYTFVMIIWGQMIVAALLDGVRLYIYTYIIYIRRGFKSNA